jgi:membrane protease YdiL (CAAX protease family)
MPIILQKAMTPSFKKLGALLLCLIFLWICNNLWSGVILENVFSWHTTEDIFIANPSSTTIKQHYSYTKSIPPDAFFHAVDCDIVGSKYLLKKGILAPEFLQAKTVVSCKYHYRLGPYAISGMQEKYRRTSPSDFKFKHLDKEIRPEADDRRSWFFRTTYFPFTKIDSYIPFSMLTVFIAAALAALAGCSFKNELSNIRSAFSTYKAAAIVSILALLRPIHKSIMIVTETEYAPKTHILSQLINEQIWESYFWAPLQEELFYRAFMITFLLRYSSPTFAVIISSILFALGHHYGIPGTLSVFFGGILYGILWIRTKSIFLVFLAHALYNFSGFLLRVLWG